MTTMRTRLIATFTTMTLLATAAPMAALAAPGTGTTVPEGVKQPADNTGKVKVLPGTMLPKFDGKSVKAALAKTIATAAGDGDSFLHGARCERTDSSGNPTGRYYDHCITLSAGSARTFTSYVLIDTACPAGNAASACYGGYVISARSDLTTTVDTGTTSDTITTVSKMRFGLKRTKATKDKRKLAGNDLYVLPTKTALTMTRVATSSSSSHSERTMVVDGQGVTVMDVSSMWIASSSGSDLSCADQGALVEAREANNIAILSGLVLGGGEAVVATAAIGAGVFLATTTVGIGTPAAVAVGLGIFATGTAFVIAMSEAVREQGATSATLHGLEAKLACEQNLKLENFKPEELEDIAEDAADHDDTSENPAAENAACGGTSVGTHTEEDGSQCETTCESSVVDGECFSECATVCVSG